MTKKNAFEEFHIEGKYIDIIPQLKEAKIEYLFHESTPMNPLSKEKSMNFVISNRQEDVLKFLEIIILWNQHLKKKGYEEIKIYNNYWNFATQSEIIYPYFKQIYLEGEQITIFGELKAKQIKYLTSPTNPKVNPEHGAIEVMIYSEDEATLIDIIQKRNAIGKRGITIYAGMEELKLKQMQTQMNASIDYIIPYQDQYQIQFNNKSNQINIFERRKGKWVLINTFLKDCEKNEIEQEISKIVNQYIKENKLQSTRKKA